MFISVQFLNRLGRRGDMRDDSAEILFQSFLREAMVSSSGMGRDGHSLTLSILQDALEDGFGKVVVARDMPEPCEFTGG